MSGACYENGLLGKPTGEPGLAEYYNDVDGVCVKDSSYVPCPDLTCCDIDAFARFSSRATRERPLPAAAEATACAILGNRHRLRGTSSPSSPDRPLTDPPLPAQLLRRCADPPRVRRLRYRARLRHLLLHLHHHPGTSTLSEPAATVSERLRKTFPQFPNRIPRFPRSQTLTQGFSGDRRAISRETASSNVDASTRPNANCFCRSDDFFRSLRRRSRQTEKNAPPLMNLPSR